jgi:dipeptidyl aminopeptidase/acylaminoacyl peptidase
MIGTRTILAMLLTAGVVAAQGTKADYDRAASLGNKYKGQVFRDKVDLSAMPDNEHFSYKVATGPGTWEYILVDPVKGDRKVGFDHAQVAKLLGEVTKTDLNPNKLPIEEWSLGKDGVIHLRSKEKTWGVDPVKGEIKPAPYPAAPDKRVKFERYTTVSRPAEAEGKTTSPDKAWTLIARNFNLFLKQESTGKEFPVTKDGKDGNTYTQPFLWSGDGKYVLAWKRKSGGDRKVTLVESSPKSQLQPRVQTYNYLKPGDDIPQSFPVLIDVQNHEEVPLDRKLFENPWAIDCLRWDPDSSRFTFLYNQRGHQVMRVVAVEAATGKVSTPINEEPKTFFDYNSKLFYRPLDETGEAIWMSERSGWNHLYLIDMKKGEAKNAITKGDWVVRNVLKLDPKTRQAWFTAGGVIPGQDPYYLHVGRVDFDGNNLTWLTEGDGTHDVLFSSDSKYVLDSYSRVDMAPVTVLRQATTGKKVCDLETADATKLDALGWKPPERFVAKGRDDTTDIYGVIWRPSNFDAKKTYPVIEYIYAGPHGAFAPKRFTPWQRTRELAELGFIVVQMDGMGTNFRSKAFHDVAWKNLGDAGFPDRIKWIKAAAAKYPYMDLNRVGIYGGSAGGQNALRALLAHGDFYKAAVADCGCHDNRMDKIWWNELWMSWPVGPHYAEASNVVNAHKLTGKLLLVVGEVDHNVDPASTMQVVNALVKANKDFDLLVIPGADHGAAETPYGNRRRMDFFVRNLLGVEPRRE